MESYYEICVMKKGNLFFTAVPASKKSGAAFLAILTDLTEKFPTSEGYQIHAISWKAGDFSIDIEASLKTKTIVEVK